MKPNNDINQVGIFDMISDEYNNYYYVTGETVDSGKLTTITLSHSYYEDAFSAILHEDLLKEYKFKHVGVPLQDRLLGSLKHLKEKNRTIFTIQDLVDNGIEVSFLDITKLHPRANPIKR